jgi:hypothetical protein
MVSSSTWSIRRFGEHMVVFKLKKEERARWWSVIRQLNNIDF